MAHNISRREVLLDSLSANSSTRTSNAMLVTDANYITASWLTQVAVASNLTVRATDDNLDTVAASSAIWSTVSVVAGQGVFSITPGARYIQFVRPAVDSMGSVIVNYRT